MATDPKWRTISRKSGQSIGNVIAVYIHMMTCASNATERGRTQGWDSEDVANALDIELDQVDAILIAMEGRVIENGILTGWEKRQPIREDSSASRAKAWREVQKEREQTQPNATERKKTLDTEEIRIDKEENKEKSKADATATRLPTDWIPTISDSQFCSSERPDLMMDSVASQFRDYWIAQGGAKGRKLDWSATWRNWVRNQRTPIKPSQFSAKPEKFDPVAYVNRNRGIPDAKPTERDITGEIFEMVRNSPGIEDVADGPPV